MYLLKFSDAANEYGENASLFLKVIVAAFAST